MSGGTVPVPLAGGDTEAGPRGIAPPTGGGDGVGPLGIVPLIGGREGAALLEGCGDGVVSTVGGGSVVGVSWRPKTVGEELSLGVVRVILSCKALAREGR